jgi:hypothetical protein
MIEISKSTETIASCNACGKANYNSSLGTKKEVDELFDLDIGRGNSNMYSRTKLCRECLGGLGDKILSYITFGEGATK